MWRQYCCLLDKLLDGFTENDVIDWYKRPNAVADIDVNDTNETSVTVVMLSPYENSIQCLHTGLHKLVKVETMIKRVHSIYLETN